MLVTRLPEGEMEGNGVYRRKVGLFVTFLLGMMV